MNAPAGFGTWRRKPDPVFAITVESEDDIYEMGESAKASPCAGGFWVCETAHGCVSAEYGDYLVTDGKGDWWPVKKAIFEARYIPASPPPRARAAVQACGAVHEGPCPEDYR